MNDERAQNFSLVRKRERKQIESNGKVFQMLVRTDKDMKVCKRALFFQEFLIGYLQFETIRYDAVFGKDILQFQLRKSEKKKQKRIKQVKKKYGIEKT